jgi:hypothetical protein
MGQCLVKGLLIPLVPYGVRKKFSGVSHASSSWCQKLSITLTPNMEAAKYVPSLCMPNYSLMAWHIEAPSSMGFRNECTEALPLLLPWLMLRVSPTWWWWWWCYCTLIDAKSFSNIMMWWWWWCYCTLIDAKSFSNMMMMLLHLDWC